MSQIDAAKRVRAVVDGDGAPRGRRALRRFPPLVRRHYSKSASAGCFSQLPLMPLMQPQAVTELVQMSLCVLPQDATSPETTFPPLASSSCARIYAGTLSCFMKLPSFICCCSGIKIAEHKQHQHLLISEPGSILDSAELQFFSLFF